MVERGDPSWTEEMGCRSFTPRVHGFQTCRSFMTSALNSPTEPSGVHYSRAIGEVSICMLIQVAHLVTERSSFLAYVKE